MFCSHKYLTSRIEVRGEVYVGLYVKCLLLLSYVTTTGRCNKFRQNFPVSNFIKTCSAVLDLVHVDW
jgi:hypothetical protein